MFYIIRHGKTDWNEEKKVQGWTDIPLNEDGRRMAEAAHDRYADMHIDICYCSPLQRARETAEILLRGRNIPIICDERLKEMGFGIYEGTLNVLDKPDCPLYPLFKDPVRYVRVEEGESFDDLFRRTGEFLKEKAEPELARGRDILVVGHGAMNCSIIAARSGFSLEHFWDGMTDNCVMTDITEPMHPGKVWKW